MRLISSDSFFLSTVVISQQQYIKGFINREAMYFSSFSKVPNDKSSEVCIKCNYIRWQCCKKIGTLCCLYTKYTYIHMYIIVLIWFYSQSFVVFVRLSQDLCFVIYFPRWIKCLIKWIRSVFPNICICLHIQGNTIKILLTGLRTIAICLLSYERQRQSVSCRKKKGRVATPHFCANSVWKMCHIFISRKHRSWCKSGYSQFVVLIFAAPFSIKAFFFKLTAFFILSTRHIFKKLLAVSESSIKLRLCQCGHFS